MERTIDSAMSVTKIAIEKYCALCGREFSSADDDIICPDDDSLLMPLKHDPLIGQLIEAKYEILELIGSGGWGSVYKARDVKLARLVAFKVLRQDLASTAEKLQRFEREAKVMSSLSHPNVCLVYDYGVLATGQPYLVLEYLAGQTLEQIIVSHGKLSATRALPLMRQTASALAAAHDMNIIHRDLKPANIMVFQNSDGVETIKIIDFGLARTYEVLAPEQLTRTGMTIGTPAYMSPEQVLGQVLDQRSDVYSFGCTLFRCLNGKMTATGKTVFEIMQAQLTTRMSKEDFESDVPDDLKRLTLACLSKEPAQRYQSMHEIAEDLSALERHGKCKRRRTAFSQKHSARIKIVGVLIALCGALIVPAILGYSINNADFPQQQEDRKFNKQLADIRAFGAAQDIDNVLKTGNSAIADLEKTGKQNSPEMIQVCTALIEALQNNERASEGVPFVKLRLNAKTHNMKEDTEQYRDAYKEAAALVRSFDEDLAPPYLKKSLDLATQHYGDDSREICEPLGKYAWTVFSTGHPQEAVQLYKKQLQLVSKHFNKKDQMYVQSRGELAWVYCNTGNYQEARKLAEEAISLTTESTPPRFRQDLFGCASLAEWKCGNLDRAIMLTKQQLAISNEMDNVYSQQIVKGQLGKYLVEAKRYKEAEPLLRETLRTLEKTGNTGDCTYKLFLTAYVDLLRNTSREQLAKQVEASGKT